MGLRRHFRNTIGSKPWSKYGLCVGRDPSLWYTEKATGKSNVGHAAKAICDACQVQKECLTYAVETHEPAGIWGGCGEKDRRFLYRRWAQKECDGWAWAWDDIECDCTWCEALELAVNGDGVLNANGEGATHGLRVTYARGCRCHPCKIAASLYSLEQRRTA